MAKFFSDSQWLSERNNLCELDGLMKILISDPYWGDRGLMQDILELAGHEIVIADDASRTLREKEATSPDVLLLELKIAKPENYQFIARLKGDPRWREVTIIALVSHEHWAERDRLEGFGFDGYICKPINFRNFAALISQIVERKRELDRRETA